MTQTFGKSFWTERGFQLTLGLAGNGMRKNETSPELPRQLRQPYYQAELVFQQKNIGFIILTTFGSFMKHVFT